MSLVTKQNRISAKPFAAVPPLLNLPAITRVDASVSDGSPFQGAGGGIDLAEGCLLTKSVKYTHQPARMVDAARSGDFATVVSGTIVRVNSLSLFPFQEEVVDQMRIIPYLSRFIQR